MDGDTAGARRRRPVHARRPHRLGRRADGVGCPCRRRVPLLRPVEHGAVRRPGARRHHRRRAVGERSHPAPDDPESRKAHARRGVRNRAAVADCGPADGPRLLGGLLPLRARSTREAERPGRPRERLVGRDGDRAVDRRVRAAIDWRPRRAPRPAATLRARRGRGQPGPRADVGGLVAGAWRGRRRAVEAGRRRPVDRRAGAAELEDLGRARTGEPRRHGVVPPRVPPDARAGRAAGHALARRDRRGGPDLGERPRHPQHVRLGHAADLPPSRGDAARRRQRRGRERAEHLGRRRHDRAARRARADVRRWDGRAAGGGVALPGGPALGRAAPACSVGDDCRPYDALQRHDRADGSIRHSRRRLVPGRDERGRPGRVRETARRADGELALAVRGRPAVPGRAVAELRGCSHRAGRVELGGPPRVAAAGGGGRRPRGPRGHHRHRRTRRHSPRQQAGRRQAAGPRGTARHLRRGHRSVGARSPVRQPRTDGRRRHVRRRRAEPRHLQLEPGDRVRVVRRRPRHVPLRERRGRRDASRPSGAADAGLDTGACQVLLGPEPALQSDGWQRTAGWPVRDSDRTGS